MSKKVGMISLGCPKNQVDGEIMLSKLADNGFEVTEECAVWDGEFAYSVMKCRYTGVTYEISDVREQTGLTDASYEDGRKYIEKQLERMKKAADGMRNSRPAEAEKIDMTMEKIRKEKGI